MKHDVLNKKMIALTSLLLTLMSVGFSQKSDSSYHGKVGKTLADSREWWQEVPKAPSGAPNVVWILLDDVGFGAASVFGGLISTPTFDSLANNGLRYTNFHTAGICAPTRAALLTGRNHHYVHEGGFSHIWASAGFPGWDGRIPSKDGTIAEVLRANGYNTFAVGKYGLTPDEDATDAGPFDRWPTGKGFDRFFGFLGSQTDQYQPDLVLDQVHVTPDGRHLNEQITDKAISFISIQHKAAPEKPFFLYYAPGATHAPHQVDSFWSNQYKGKFDEGWDAYRSRVIEKQRKLGIIPVDAQLPERNPYITAWDKLSPDEKKLYARFFEVYAGYLTYTDHEVGRLISYLKESGQLDNTIVFVIIGDNGASKEGSLQGVINRDSFLQNDLSNAELVRANLDSIGEIGTPAGKETNYPLGWAQAANTPFKFWKQDANSEGGTRNPLIVFFPKGIKDKGSIRNQYGHVIDLLPTTLEFAGIKYPASIRGISQDTVQGTSLVYSFTDAKASSRHTEQYYYIFGPRSIYKDGWKAEVYHHPDLLELVGIVKKDTATWGFDRDVWELYDLSQDFNERVDLAKKYPEKTQALKLLFDENARRYNIYPLIDFEDMLKGKLHHPNGSNSPGPIK